ncbi:YbhB/YbcL family Raf kinase inhibitor-like protein [Lysobacter sp. OAE881]|uniref:YbhB/YbcL family Raf kinase inhibitor-like protein n=1 Tax=Lysobacter sp. OAE881 TaxID=2663813 RepID=UPI003391198B
MPTRPIPPRPSACSCIGCSTTCRRTRQAWRRTSRPDRLPFGTKAGQNGWQRAGYGGPCPPIGRHRYFFKLYALDIELPHLGDVDKLRLLDAMEGHVLGQAEFIGTYQKGDQ